MAFNSPTSSSPVQVPDGALRTPAIKRISTPSSLRLQTITESSYAPPIPPKSNLRNSNSVSSLSRNLYFTPAGLSPDKRSSVSTAQSAPPAYEWPPAPLVVEDAGPVDYAADKKLSALRRQRGEKQRGGRKRIVLIVALVFLIIVALAVGLGVGLTVGRRNGDSSQSGSSSAPSGADNNGPVTQPFPLGEFSLLTALTNVTTTCTTNPTTWSCYPSVIYDPSDSDSAAPIMSTFNWVLRNTSSSYATIRTAPTSDQGVPANLSVSSTDNPFGITFNDRNLTYISPSSNASAARYVFSFTMKKAVFPTTSLTSNGITTQCFFNQTIFTGTMYLSQPRTYPPSGASTSGASYAQWPYAVDISQSSAGGDSTPACYEYVNGVIGNRVTTALAPTSNSSQCLCDYRNF
ncbi:Hypothetical predicted protein [Lecanosticta acicola]|uniref:Tat pathway signal sequence n=1 Tax=Lecanosticta acicola TaxID=111012 RepID=A0AAI8W0S2_9PEZI|nr:Hypothetical predicted protein [Lecanosticta acicola]